MKKLLRIEIAVLAVVLLTVLVIGIVKGPSAPTASVTDPTTEPTTPTTAPTTPPTGPLFPEDFVPTWNTYPDDRDVRARQYFVYDCDLQQFLIFSGSSNAKVYPASITKLFTAYVALKYLEPSHQVTAGSALDLISWDSSVAYIRKGDVLTVEQLVEAMLLPSGNDAAYLLACEAGRTIWNNPNMPATDAVKGFMERLNYHLQTEGMTGTHLVTPDGIHKNDHYTCFADLVQIGQLAMENPIIRKYTAEPRKELVLHGETLVWKNTNALINPDSDYYCPYALGLKTGYTSSAGNCLLSAFQVGERELIIGVFGCPNSSDRFDDTLQLFNKVALN